MKKELIYILFICSLLFLLQFTYQISESFKNAPIREHNTFKSLLYVTIALLILSVSLEIIVALRIKNQKTDASTI